MSLTEAETVFASIHEDALNDLLTAVCNARPHYLVYGSPAFVPANTVAETTMAAIGFPGIPGGIQWRLRLSIPRVDLFKQSAPLPPPLTLGPGQFSASLDAQLCIECRRLRIDPKPPRQRDERKDPQRQEQHALSELSCFRLKVAALGHIEHVLTATGEDAIALAVDAVEIVDIAPDEVESFLECLMFLILQAVLAEIRLPLRALRAGAFELALTVGPLIEDDQVKMRGNV
ncbi:MAG TPA: hypothetical protein VF861_16820 [Telluria sp.]